MLLRMQGYVAQVSDIEVMAQLMAKTQTVRSILSSRQATLQVVSSFWAKGDIRGALTALLQSSGVTLHWQSYQSSTCFVPRKAE